MWFRLAQRWFFAGTVAGFALAALPARAQEASQTDPTLSGSQASGTSTDQTGQLSTPPPRLTIAPEDETSPPKRKRKAAEDPYAPTGLREGGLVLHPSLGIDAVVSSNVRQAAVDAKAGVGLSLSPGLSFESDWLRHSLSGQASGTFLRYVNQPGIKADTADAALAGRFDIRRDTFASLDAGYTLTQTGLGNGQIPADAIGTRADQTYSAGLGLTHDFGAFSTSLKSGLAYNTYGDVKLSGGGTDSNSDRNYLSPSLAMRATYTDPPAFKPYVEVGIDRRIYDHTRDKLGFKRSSNGVALSAGVVIDDSPIWQGDVAVSYLHRSYDDPTLAAASALGLSGSLTWSPTELTNVILDAGTSLVDNIDTTTSANREWTASLTINHALRDNILLHAGIGDTIEKTTGGYDNTYTGSLGLAWKLTPEFAWTAGYDVTWLKAAQASRNFSEHRLSVGLVWTR